MTILAEVQLDLNWYKKNTTLWSDISKIISFVMYSKIKHKLENKLYKLNIFNI